MDLKTINLSDADIAELSQDFGPKEAMEALCLGFAMGLSECGLTPSEFEGFSKLGLVNWGEVPAEILGGYGTAAAGIIGAGALGGAYSGYARSRVEQTMNGTDNPDIVALRKKIQAYRSMSSDLKRTNALQHTGGQPVV